MSPEPLCSGGNQPPVFPHFSGVLSVGYPFSSSQKTPGEVSLRKPTRQMYPAHLPNSSKSVSHGAFKGGEVRGGNVGAFCPQALPLRPASSPQVHRRERSVSSGPQSGLEALVCRLKTVTPALYRSQWCWEDPEYPGWGVLCMKQASFKVGVLYPYALETPEHGCPSYTPPCTRKAVILSSFDLRGSTWAP